MQRCVQNIRYRGIEVKAYFPETHAAQLPAGDSGILFKNSTKPETLDVQRANVILAKSGSEG